MYTCIHVFISVQELMCFYFFFTPFHHYNHPNSFEIWDDGFTTWCAPGERLTLPLFSTVPNPRPWLFIHLWTSASSSGAQKPSWPPSRLPNQKVSWQTLTIHDGHWWAGSRGRRTIRNAVKMVFGINLFWITETRIPFLSHAHFLETSRGGFWHGFRVYSYFLSPCPHRLFSHRVPTNFCSLSYLTTI